MVFFIHSSPPPFSPLLLSSPPPPPPFFLPPSSPPDAPLSSPQPCQGGQHCRGLGMSYYYYVILGLSYYYVHRVFNGLSLPLLLCFIFKGTKNAPTPDSALSDTVMKSTNSRRSLTAPCQYLRRGCYCNAAAVCCVHCHKTSYIIVDWYNEGHLTKPQTAAHHNSTLQMRRRNWLNLMKTGEEGHANALPWTTDNYTTIN